MKNMVNSSMLDYVIKSSDFISKITFDFLNERGLNLNTKDLKSFVDKIISLDSKEFDKYFQRFIGDAFFHRYSGNQNLLDVNSTRINQRQLIFNCIDYHNGIFGRIQDLDFLSFTTKSIKGSSKDEWNGLTDYTRLRQFELSSQLGINQDYAVMRTIADHKILAFNNLTDVDLVKLREGGNMKEIREYFKLSSRLINTTTLDNIEEVTSHVKTEFEKFLDEERRRMELEQHKMKKQLKLSAFNFAATFSLSVATGVLPILAPISIPLTVITGIIGTSSGIDVINSHLRRKKNIKEIQKRPIHVLLKSNELENKS